MQQGERSVMAERVAVARALHQLLDDDPKIFTDPLALPIIGPDGQRWMHANQAWLQTTGLRRTRAMVSIRARFAEDELERAIGQGTNQYVVLGAGLDTFAYRRLELAGRLTVFEVDNPATQAWKRERLAAAAIPEPANLRFVPVDFNEHGLAAQLAIAGFQRDAPAFFSWLGVTYYLPRESVLETLRLIGSQAAASQVVFDFAVAQADLPPEFRDVMRQINEYASQSGETWQTAFSPRALAAELRQLGFSELCHVDADAAHHRYLEDRRDSLLTGPLVGLMSARQVREIAP